MSTGRQRDVLFDGMDVRVYDCASAFEGDMLFVTFPNFGWNNSLANPGFGEEFLARQCIPSLIFTVSWNHWFQTRELDDAMAAVQPVLR